MHVLNPQVLGQRIKAALALCGLTVEEAAATLGFDRELLEEWILGKTPVPEHALRRIADLTGIGLPYFIDVPEFSELSAQLEECTRTVRELIEILRPPGEVEDFPAGRIGMAIYQGRIRRGWTVSHLARITGVSRTTVIAWETGRAVPSRRRWEQLTAIMPELGEVKVEHVRG